MRNVKFLMRNIFLIICAALLMTGCGEVKEVKADVLPLPDPIEMTLQSMTLAEKVGQMVMVGFYGTEINDDIIYSLNNFHFGGVILFDRNLETIAQTKKLTEDISAAANQKAPLFFALDEEGGRVARGRHMFEVAPSQESIGLTWHPNNAMHWARHNANILRSIGVNLNFAPVADVGSKDTRSFGDDAQMVAKFVDAAAQGYENEKIISDNLRGVARDGLRRSQGSASRRYAAARPH